MKLKTDVEAANTQRKLAELEKLIQKRERSTGDAPAHELSLESMRRFAKKLRSEIEEYERSHQTA
jgi:hypothetical protein